MKIIVLHPGALGDIILSLPAVRELRRSFPGADVTFAGHTDYLGAVAREYVDEIVSLSALPLHNLFGPGTLAAEEVSFWRSFDRIVSWTGYGDADFAHKLHAIHSQTLVVRWRPNPGEMRHVAQIMLDSLFPWVRKIDRIEPPVLVQEPEDRLHAQEWLSEHGWTPGEVLVAIHPGAGSVAKRWPVENFQGVAAHLLQDPDIRLLVIEGPAEAGLSARVAAGLARICIAENLPLPLLASTVLCARAFIGNDSGVAHLAAALGVPSLVLFGPTLPANWAPLGRRVLALRDPRGRLDRLEPSYVIERIHGFLH